MVQKIVSSTLNQSLIDLAWVEEIDWVESNLGRQEMKIHMVGLEYLVLNTSVGGSLSENVSWKCRIVLMAFSTNGEAVEAYI